MDDLAEFLLARIAEDEAEARNASAAIGDGEWFGSPVALRRVFSATLTEVARSAAPRHIARWDPARVLAKCKADRLIVEHLARPMVWIGPGPGDFLPGDHRGPADEHLLRLLALPYADHEDYRAEWKP